MARNVRHETAMIFIHSRKRTEMIKKTLPKWLNFEVEKRCGLFVVVEPRERLAYKEAIAPISKHVEIIPLRKNNMGISYSRRRAHQNAWRAGKRSFITADDDLYPRDDPLILLKAARNKDVLGIGAMVSIYTLLMSIQPYTGQYFTNGSLGFGGCYAMNTVNFRKIGGWDDFFIGPGQEDRGVAIRGMHELGMLWRVESNFQIDHVNQIGDPGGFDSLCKRLGHDRDYFHHKWHVWLHRQYPEYISDPAKCKDKKRKQSKGPGQFKRRYNKCSMRYSWNRMGKDWCGMNFTKAIPVKDERKYIYE